MERVEPRSCVGFTAASALSNFPDPARTGKTAHNSPRFLMETLLRQCSLEPKGSFFLTAVLLFSTRRVYWLKI